MKQALHSLLVAIGAFLACGATMVAQENTATFYYNTIMKSSSDDNDFSYTDEEYEGKQGGVTIAVSNGSTDKKDYFDDYKYMSVNDGYTMTISSDATITGVTINSDYSGDFSLRYLTASTGVYERKGYEATWRYEAEDEDDTKGGAKKIVFKASGSAVFMKKITVTTNSDVEGEVLASAGLKWSCDATCYDYDGETGYVKPTLSYRTTAAITYESDNVYVAEGANGKVAINGYEEGVATIKAKCAASEDGIYKAGEATVTVRVYEKDTYSKATKVVSGRKYLLVAETEDGGYQYAITSNAVAKQSYLNMKDGKGTDLDAVDAVKGNEIVITGTEGSYTLTDADGREMWGKKGSSKIQLGGEVEGGGTWNITIGEDGAASIIDGSTGLVLQLYEGVMGVYTGETGALPMLYELKSETAVEVVSVGDDVESGERYNMMGQKVDSGYKGLVISGGKLMMSK